MRNVSLTTVGAACAILMFLSFGVGIALMATVVLAFPATLGAAAARMIL